MGIFSAAGAAYAVEIYTAAFDDAVKVFAGKFFQLVFVHTVQIEDRAAAPAYEVIVRRGIAVIAICDPVGRQLLDLADIGEKREIAIDRSKTDIRKNFPDVGKNHIRCRVVFPHSQVFHDGVSLAAVL